MSHPLLKQPSLKPQDLVVILQVVSRRETSSYAELARDLYMSASEVHGAVKRLNASHLMDRESGTFSVNRASLLEFLLHGVRYAFPALEGPVQRGLPTGVSAPPLRDLFEHVDTLPIVWPHPAGDVRGTSICPLYPTVPSACSNNPALYEALALLDALRGGAARERELAATMLGRFVQ
jgi:DNA-binding MarR family transcriptional regulator